MSRRSIIAWVSASAAGSGKPALDRLAEATAIAGDWGRRSSWEDVTSARHAPWRDHPLFRPGYEFGIFAHIGASARLRPRRQSLSRVGAMGCSIASRAGNEARGTTLRIGGDDARLRDPNDCDVAPDGRIFFTDSTTRYDAHDWALDSIESRPTGRLLCYDPRNGKTTTLLDNYRYANGVCIAHDGQSLFFAESWACRVHRYWFDGPKAGQVECVIKDMPGYPDNINRASDGGYWMAWLGMHAQLRPGAAPPGDARA
jgi:ribose transport system permease protein